MLKAQSIYYALEDRYKKILKVFDQDLYFNVIACVVAFDLKSRNLQNQLNDVDSRFTR